MRFTKERGKFVSDLEKFKQLFDNIGIEYIINENSTGEISLAVSKKALFCYGNSGELDIDFSKDGKFVMFVPSGD